MEDLVMRMSWEGKRVLVTGATGFIGSWLTEALVAKGASVSVLITSDALGTGGIPHLMDTVTVVRGDVRNGRAVAKGMEGTEVVFHLAAITQVIDAIQNPVEASSVNIFGTLAVLEQLRKSDAQLVFASTDKVYGEPESLPIRETHPLSAKSPYDASKLAADRLCYSYVQTYDLPISIVRCSNIYGGRDHNALRAVPDFVLSALDGRDIVIRGTGNHVRDFIYVTDVVEAYLTTAAAAAKGETFNFGTEHPVTISELAQLIAGFFPTMPAIRILGKETKGEIDRQYLSSEKAARVLKWKPRTELRDGLAKTIAWYRENAWWRPVMARVAR